MSSFPLLKYVIRNITIALLMGYTTSKTNYIKLKLLNRADAIQRGNIVDLFVTNFLLFHFRLLMSPTRLSIADVLTSSFRQDQINLLFHVYVFFTYSFNAGLC